MIQNSKIGIVTVYDGIRSHPSRSNDKVIKKAYHKLSRTSSFQRQGWWLIENPHVVLVHYLGDESEYTPTSHGNCKSENANEFIRTCPSVLKSISSSEASSSTTYQNLVNEPCHSELNAVLRPRDLRQVQNLQLSVRQAKRLSRDDYYNLMLIAQELKDYVFEIVTYPDLTCFFGLSELLKEFNNLLKIQSNDVPTLFASYDTTFNIGDFYVTPLVFRHIMFERSPCIPLAFMIHQRKYQSLHEDFFRILTRFIPNLKKSSFAIVTDREKGIINSITEVLPNVNLVLCWNHIKRDLRQWLRSHGASTQDLTVYMKDLDTLLNSDSKEEFDSSYISISSKWSDPLLAYFEKNLKRDIECHAGKWLLVQLSLYTPHSGITNNSSEGMNTVIKRLMGWKEVPVDTAVLCFYHLQNFYLNEILRGLCNTGNFKIRTEFQGSLQDPADIQFSENISSPQDIVDKIKSASIESHPTDSQRITDTPGTEPPSNSQSLQVSQLPTVSHQHTQLAMAEAGIANNRMFYT